MGATVVRTRRNSGPGYTHIFRKVSSLQISRDDAYEALLSCDKLPTLKKTQYIETLLWRFEDDEAFIKRCWNFGGDYVRQSILARLKKSNVKDWMIEQALNADYLTGLANVLSKRLELIEGNDIWEKKFLKKLFGTWKKNYNGNIDFFLQNWVIPNNKGLKILDKINDIANVKDILE